MWCGTSTGLEIGESGLKFLLSLASTVASGKLLNLSKAYFSHI